MITLYAFGPAFGLPDPSPFVMKAQVLLKLAGLPHKTETSDPRKAPKGKLPYIRDGNDVIADSTLIRLYLEQRYNIDFDTGLSQTERGIAWAVEKMCEDHLHWFLMQERWADDANFKRGPAKFFEVAPAPARPLIRFIVRRQVLRSLHGQGAGRYTEPERIRLADRAFASISAILGDKPYLMSDTPCGADATVFAFVSGALCPVFDSGIRAKARSYSNLTDYCARLSQRFYPGFQDSNEAAS